MKKMFHNIVSTLMAFLVLFSTVSFTVDKHFCGSILVDLAVFSEAKTCGMEAHQDDAEPSEKKDSCCSNEKIAIEGQDELKSAFKALDLDQQVFLASFTYSYFNLFEGLPEQIIPFSDYSPPLLVTDIQLMDQVFLI